MRALERKTRGATWMTPFGREGLGDVFFDRLWPEWRRDIGEEWTPSVNFFEKDGKYHLTADVPGMSKDDIRVTVENGHISVSGNKEETQEEEEANYYMKETRYGSFSRSFRLPGEVDEEKIEASYKDGVLTVVIPKKEESKTKKIAVH